MVKILDLFHRYDIVNLLGEPGIGKTSLTKEVANYFRSRDTEQFSNGVLYFNLSKTQSLSDLKT